MLALVHLRLANTLAHQSEVRLITWILGIPIDLFPEDFGGRGGYRGGRSDRYDDRRGGYGGGYGGGGGRYDDSYRSSRYDDRRGYGRRDDYGSRGIDRYASGGRDDRYGGRDDRRSGYDSSYRDSGRGGGYSDAAPRDSYAGGSDDRYSRR